MHVRVRVQGSICMGGEGPGELRYISIVGTQLLPRQPGPAGHTRLPPTHTAQHLQLSAMALPPQLKAQPPHLLRK